MPMKPRKGIERRELQNDSDLRLDSQTVAYELWLLVSTATGLRSAADQITINAYIESFGIHCRALTYFLFAHLDRTDDLPWFFGEAKQADVLASDFADGWTAKSGDPPLVLRQAKDRADKEVAHITHRRRGLNQPGSVKISDWQLVDECSAICEPFTGWLQIVDPQKIEPVAGATMLRDLHQWSEVIASEKWRGTVGSNPDFMQARTEPARNIHRGPSK